MATFVHLTPEKNVAAIVRGGIKTTRLIDGVGVFAMPVTPNFYVSHQWLRELKRGGQRTICGVYFRIPDDEPVLVGHYNSEKRSMTAAEAAGVVMHADNAEGYEVIVPRKIKASEIRRSVELPQVMGWRYFPEAHGRKPCGCPVCLGRGEIKSRRIREAFEADL